MRFFVSVIASTAIVTASMLAACSPRDAETPDASRFEAEDARAALIGMVEQSDEDALRYGLPLLKTDKVVANGPSPIEIGKWQIDLGGKRFVLLLASERGLYEVSGLFEQALAGKWLARVTQRRQTQLSCRCYDPLLSTHVPFRLPCEQPRSSDWSFPRVAGAGLLLVLRAFRPLLEQLF